jgi:hypothetical protein
MLVRVPEANRSAVMLIQFAAACRHDLVFHWLIGVANESELAVAAARCADLHFATALVAIEEGGFDFKNPIAVRALVRWRTVEIRCVLPENGLPGTSLLTWHLALLAERQIPMRNPKLVATGTTSDSPAVRLQSLS